MRPLSMVCVQIYPLPANMESAEIFACFSPHGLHVAYIRARWPLPEQRDEPFEGRARPLCHYLHAAIALVAHITAQPKLDGSLDHEVAKADALHSPLHLCVEFLHCVSLRLFVFVPVHATNNSIIRPLSPVPGNEIER